MRRRSRRLGLRARATVAFGVTALVLSVTIAVVAYALVRTYLIDQRESAALNQAFANARVLRSALDGADPDVPEILAGLRGAVGGDILLRYRDRWFTSSVAADPGDLPDSLLRVVLEEEHAARQQDRVRGRPRLVVGVPVPAVDAAFFQAFPEDEVERTLNTLGTALIVAGMVATVVAAAVGRYASGAVLRPLRDVAGAADRIAEGDLGLRLESRGDPDLEPLVEPFNEMVGTLEARIEREQRFASDVSHELRSPIAALAAAVEVAHRRRDQLPEPVVIAVDALAEQVSSFNRLVLDLLEISRFDAGAARLDLEPIELHRFLSEIAHPRGVEVVCGEHVVVAADRVRLKQAIANLLDNADRYAGGPDQVVVEPDVGVVRIAVEDRGPGVTDDEKEEIFGRFARGHLADRPGAPKGTGLGLALVAEHATLHRGRAWVEDRPDGGARFVVELPSEAP
jgi:two-component system, OmpR family, sensor histidine kinase MtrB